MTCSAYIRLYLYCYLFMCIICINELKNTGNRKDHYTSYTFAVMLLVFLVSSTLLMFYYCWKNECDLEAKSHPKVQELYNALKSTKMARLYYPIYCLRRLLLASSLLLLEHMDGKIRLFCFVVIQAAYFIYF